MGKKIKALAVVFVLAVLFSVYSSAEQTYRIQFDYGVASVIANRIINPNSDAYTGQEAVKLADPSCEGFTFEGWYTDPNRQTQITEIAAGSAEDITLYAKWYEKNYSIRYILMQTDSEIPADSIENPNITSRLTGEAVYLEDAICLNDAYIFDGWYKDASYTQKITYISEYTTENITLYAKWKKAVYPIRYDMGDITLSLYPAENNNPSSYIYNEAVTLTAPYSADPSFTFDGWYTDETFSTPVTAISAGQKGSITVYAKWVRAVYHIRYILTDGSAVAPDTIHNANPATRAAAQEVVLEQASTDNRSYVFAGWYTSPDYKENTKITAVTADIYQDITVYAKWEEAVYRLHYDFGKVNLLVTPIDNPNPDSYRYGDTITPAPVEAEGFIFNGWCKDKELKQKITAVNADDYGDITLYADFTEKTYSVKYVVTDKGVQENRVINKNETIRTTSQFINLSAPQLLPPAEFEFGGWYLDSAFTQRVYEIRAYTTSNMTIYAKWIRINSYRPVWGDADLANQLTAQDARLILRYSAGLEKDFNDIQRRVADINNDGTITAADARLALRLSAHLETEEALILKYGLPTIELIDGEVVFTKNE